jgi:hypothetical protein
MTGTANTTAFYSKSQYKFQVPYLSIGYTSVFSFILENQSSFGVYDTHNPTVWIYFILKNHSVKSRLQNDISPIQMFKTTYNACTLRVLLT